MNRGADSKQTIIFFARNEEYNPRLLGRFLPGVKGMDLIANEPSNQFEPALLRQHLAVIFCHRRRVTSI